MLPLVDLAVVGDGLVRLRRVTPEGLRGFCDGSSSLAARCPAALVRAEVDSPMETRLRMLIMLAGLPEPAINHRIVEDGRVRYRST